MRLIRNPAQRVGHAPLVASGWRMPSSVHIAKRHPHRASEAQRQLFELRAVVACRFGCGDQRHEQRQRWQPWNDELRLPRPRHRGRDRFQMRGLEVESEAAVAGPVFMAAFEARAFVAEKHGAWGEYG
jgi:hypothetical protein